MNRICVEPCKTEHQKVVGLNNWYWKGQSKMNYVWEDYSSKYSEKIEAFLDSEAIKYTGCEDGFDNFYSYWEEELRANFWCKVILIENEPIAIIAFAKAPDNIFTIQEFIVSPNNRGKGYGSAILKELLAHSKKIIGQDIFVAKAVIYPDNKASQRAFQKAGFVYTGTHSDEDAWYYQYIKPNIRQLTCEDLKTDFLNGFNHNQTWNKQWVKENNSWVLKDCVMSREWDNEKREWIPTYLLEQINRGGATIGAYVKDKLVGFCSIDGTLRNGYANMTMLFIDDDYKRLGIGKKLFLSISEKAKTIGAEKLFISAIPSQDTITFYMAVGCKDAIYLPNEFLDSPNDRYLELELGKK